MKDVITLKVKHTSMSYAVTLMESNNHALIARIGNFLAGYGFDVHMSNKTKGCICGSDNCPCPLPIVVVERCPWCGLAAGIDNPECPSHLE